MDSTTIYVVTEYFPYEGGTPLAVFSTKEAAEHYAEKKQGYGQAPYYEVESFPLDAVE